MGYVAFRVSAPMASWGEVAVGERRGSADRPSRSAVCGLVAAALGMPRDLPADAPVSHEQLASSFTMAVRVDDAGSPLADYHTAQRRPATDDGAYATRREELSVGQERLRTTTSVRDYRTGVAYTVVLRVSDTAPVDADRIADALNNPVYAPFVGRRCCPLGAPMAAISIQATDALSAMNAYDAMAPAHPVPVHVEGKRVEVAMDHSMAEPTMPPGRLETRRDAVSSRRRRQFDLRAELVSYVPVTEDHDG